jgi:hypothetical protein
MGLVDHFGETIGLGPTEQGQEPKVAYLLSNLETGKSELLLPGMWRHKDYHGDHLLEQDLIFRTDPESRQFLSENEDPSTITKLMNGVTDEDGENIVRRVLIGKTTFEVLQATQITMGVPQYLVPYIRELLKNQKKVLEYV